MCEVRSEQVKGPSVSKLTRQGPEAESPRWGWVEATVWTERMLAALGNGVQGGKWFSLMDKVYRANTLRAAWQQVRANAGAAGVDRQTVEKFEEHADRYLGELHEALRAGTYRAQPVRRTWIPKGPGQFRPLGIPVVKDRVVQAAVKLVIEPIFEVSFVDGSYGFRPGRGAKDALREVDGLIKAGYTHVVDADLKSYFDTIPHTRLRARLRERISDGAVLGLLDQWLEQDVMDGLERWTPTAGTPQGAVISPLLANCYLHELDVLMAASGYRMVRYADDFVVLCQSPEQAAAALERIAAWVEENGLTLHPDKTRVVDVWAGSRGFEFLGYRFAKWRRMVRKKSLDSLRERIRETTPRRAGTGLQGVIERLNPMLRGWFEYFKHAAPDVFGRLDKFIRRRLRTMLRYQEKRPGRGLTPEDHRRWNNAFFATQGLFTLATARAEASRSR